MAFSSMSCSAISLIGCAVVVPSETEFDVA